MLFTLPNDTTLNTTVLRGLLRLVVQHRLGEEITLTFNRTETMALLATLKELSQRVDR